jgi:dTDP-4-dehydrorhamnose 3,5-epimerase
MRKLKVEKTTLDGVLVVHPLTQHEDFRGDYVETYNEEMYRAAGITEKFVQDDYATSTKHVLRGIHGDAKTVKLISCLYGRIYVVVVNNDPESSQFRRWQGFTLSDVNRLQICIPAKFGNAYLVMSDVSVFHYKQTTYYDRPGQFTILWNDPAYKFWWPIDNPIVSQRDART